MFKSGIPNGRDISAQGNAGQLFASIKCFGTDAGDIPGDGHRFQVLFVFAGIACNGVHLVSHTVQFDLGRNGERGAFYVFGTCIGNCGSVFVDRVNALCLRIRQFGSNLGSYDFEICGDRSEIVIDASYFYGGGSDFFVVGISYSTFPQDICKQCLYKLSL